MKHPTAEQVGEEIRETLADPSASDWLKANIRALSNRDPLDASIDAQALERLMTMRLNALLQRGPR